MTLFLKFPILRQILSTRYAEKSQVLNFFLALCWFQSPPFRQKVRKNPILSTKKMTNPIKFGPNPTGSVTNFSHFLSFSMENDRKIGPIFYRFSDDFSAHFLDSTIHPRQNSLQNLSQNRKFSKKCQSSRTFSEKNIIFPTKKSLIRHSKVVFKDDFSLSRRFSRKKYDFIARFHHSDDKFSISSPPGLIIRSVQLSKIRVNLSKL